MRVSFDVGMCRLHCGVGGAPCRPDSRFLGTEGIVCLQFTMTVDAFGTRSLPFVKNTESTVSSLP